MSLSLCFPESMASRCIYICIPSPSTFSSSLLLCWWATVSARTELPPEETLTVSVCVMWTLRVTGLCCLFLLSLNHGRSTRNLVIAYGDHCVSLSFLFSTREPLTQVSPYGFLSLWTFILLIAEHKAILFSRSSLLLKQVIVVDCSCMGGCSTWAEKMGIVNLVEGPGLCWWPLVSYRFVNGI